MKLPIPEPISRTRCPSQRRELLEHPPVVALGPGQPQQGLVPRVGVVLVVDERVPEDRPQGDDPVRPADLLAFLSRSGPQ